VMMSPDFIGSANAENMALRRVHQAFDVTVHLRQVRGSRRLTGVVVLGDGVGDRRWVYGMAPDGRVVREIALLGDLPPKLSHKLSHYLREVPPV
jgi:hypothetical protein